MMPDTPRPDRIEADADAAGEPLAQRILARAREEGIPFVVREARRGNAPGAEGAPGPSRRTLSLRRCRGRWIRPFQDCTCGERREYYLTLVQGCPFGCAYCYLRGYLDDPGPSLFVNLGDLDRELEAFLGSEEAQGARVHAAHLGELVAWEAWTGLTERLSASFGRFPRTRLEIRTKTAPAGAARAGPPPSNVIRSWSLSPASFAARFEPGLPSPRERLAAAAREAAGGAGVGLRLDPVILLPGWEAAWEDLLHEAGESLRGAAVESVEMGTFRCARDAAESIRRGPGRALLAGEVVAGSDGKVRYFWPLREKAYRFLLPRIRRAFGPRTPVRLCMEPAWMEERVFGGE